MTRNSHYHYDDEREFFQALEIWKAEMLKKHPGIEIHEETVYRAYNNNKQVGVFGLLPGYGSIFGEHKLKRKTKTYAR